MQKTSAAFMDAADVARDLLSSTQLAEHWSERSALEEFSVSGLAGHLLRGLTTVETYLEGPEADGEPIGAGEYFGRLVSADITVPGNVAIRARGEESARGGPESVALQAEDSYRRLLERLPAEDPARRLKVAGDLVLTLEEYLRTRVVELVVHSDDLALSIGVDPKPLGRETMGVAIAALVDIARFRHGDLAVVRALARRERDDAAVLRVI